MRKRKDETWRMRERREEERQEQKKREKTKEEENKKWEKEVEEITGGRRTPHQGESKNEEKKVKL